MAANDSALVSINATQRVAELRAAPTAVHVPDTAVDQIGMAKNGAINAFHHGEAVSHERA